MMENEETGDYFRLPGSKKPCPVDALAGVIERGREKRKIVRRLALSIILVALTFIGLSITALFGWDFIQKKLDEDCWDSRRADVENLVDETGETKYALHSLRGLSPDFAPAIPTTFLIEEPDFCEAKKELKVIITVKSEVKRATERNAIRRKWVKKSNEIGVVFLVGNSTNKEEQKKLKEESDKHHDIVQGSYLDSFDGRIYKVLNGLNWVSLHCNDAPWFMSANDDFNLDVTALLFYIEHASGYADYQNRIYGFVRENSKVIRPEDFSTLKLSYRKYIMRREEYECERYPKYCLGKAWFTSARNVIPLMLVSSQIKYMRVEDVFFTGHLARILELEHEEVDVSYRRPRANRNFG